MSFRDKKKYFRDIWGLNYRDTGCFLQNLLEYGKLVPPPPKQGTSVHWFFITMKET